MVELEYVATKTMQVAGEAEGDGPRTVRPGDVVPGAARWRNLYAYLEMGHLIPSSDPRVEQLRSIHAPQPQGEVYELDVHTSTLEAEPPADVHFDSELTDLAIEATDAEPAQEAAQMAQDASEPDAGLDSHEAAPVAVGVTEQESPPKAAPARQARRPRSRSRSR